MQPITTTSTNNNNRSGANRAFFDTFFQGWLIRQQNYLDQLRFTLGNNIQNKPERELKALVSQVLNHYHEYYTAKAIVARGDNVFMMFAPPWFSSIEHTFLWIAGFKPGLAFKLVNNSVKDLSDHQLGRVDRLRMETRAAERQLSNEMARIQQSLAVHPPIIELAKIYTPGRIVGGETRDDVDAAIHALREEMEALVGNADKLRMTTARKVVEILNPLQAVEFLAAATQLQVKIRMCGWQREAVARGAN